MPQLRDSGTRSLHATEPVPSAEMDGFCRIFGVETEYGVAVTGAERPVDAGQVAMTMFQPIVSRSRSTNTYLANGSRLYLDVGSHPEYATAEARDPREALAQDLAGEHVMRNLALKAQRKLRESYGAHATIHVFKNNVDSAGHAFGCHENYLVRRFVPLETIEHQLLPFLITRQLYTGAGRMTPDGFQITQRADFLDEAVSSATTRSRPMVNTRDEPHADPDSFRRLHVIIGDSNRSQWSTWMKLAVTHLVLCAIEDAFRHGVPSGFEQYAFADPAAANRTVSRFLDNPRAELTLESGESVSALGLQRRYSKPMAMRWQVRCRPPRSTRLWGSGAAFWTRWSVVHTMRSPTAWTGPPRSVCSTRSNAVARTSPSPRWNSLSSTTTTSPTVACTVRS